MAVGYETFDSRIECKEPPVLTGQHKIILVTADVSAWPRFRKALGFMAAKGMLVARLVFDECQAFFADVSYRHALKYPFMLRANFNAQVVLLSGTLPPIAEPFLLQTFLLKNPIVLRTHSSRFEIAYRIVAPASQGQMAGRIRDILATAHIDTELDPIDTWLDNDKYLIYVPFVNSGKDLAKALNLDFYHADQEQRTDKKVQHRITPQEQAAILERWRSGEKQGLVATSALTSGFHEPHIRLVIHGGDPYSQVDYNQEAGRAGRDEEDAVSIVIPFHVRSDLQNMSLRSGLADFQGTQAMIDYLRPKHQLTWPESCLRYQQTRHIDGKGHTCTQFKSPLCSCMYLLISKLFFFNSAFSSMFTSQ